MLRAERYGLEDQYVQRAGKQLGLFTGTDGVSPYLVRREYRRALS
jgi:hypothetical protein